MSELRFLDEGRLDACDAEAFRARTPYPWHAAPALLRDAAWASLRETLPPLEAFEPVFGKPRRFGQAPHDRYALAWSPELPLPGPWRDFVAELRGSRYRAWLERMLGRGGFRLRFHWHYTPGGCSVSPHCDARDKLASHIFYLNGADEWRAEWGGETLVLDDGGRFDRRSSPRIEEFERCIAPRGTR